MLKRTLLTYSFQKAEGKNNLNSMNSIWNSQFFFYTILFLKLKKQKTIFSQNLLFLKNIKEKKLKSTVKQTKKIVKTKKNKKIVKTKKK